MRKDNSSGIMSGSGGNSNRQGMANMQDPRVVGNPNEMDHEIMDENAVGPGNSDEDDNDSDQQDIYS